MSLALDRWLARETIASLVTFILLGVIGACAWGWNTYSNQHPEAVGFDFWDSSRHFWGYLLTRFYKAYIWLWLMPSLVHIQIGIIVCIRRLLRDASEQKGIVLEPFHSDDAGGLSVFVDTALNPMIPTVFIGSMISLSAVLVHRRYDVTTVSGLTLACLTLVLLYFAPGTTLRSVIQQEKRRQISQITQLQQRIYGQISESVSNSELSGDVDAMMALTSVISRIRSLSEWPQLARVIRFATIAWTSPTVLWIANKMFEKLSASITF